MTNEELLAEAKLTIDQVKHVCINLFIEKMTIEDSLEQVKTLTYEEPQKKG